MKTYRRHYCDRRHRSYSTLAKCLWPRAAWITGEGPYALLAHCRTLTVTLHVEPEDAETAEAFIDQYGCGGACGRQHEIVRITLPGENVG